MQPQFLHLIIALLVLQPKCELTPDKHSVYIRFLLFLLKTMFESSLVMIETLLSAKTIEILYRQNAYRELVHKVDCSTHISL
jgi:hypothetical protein